MEDRLPSAREKREFFLIKAEEADRQAAAATDRLVRQAWREIAESWRYLADEATRRAGG